MRLFVSLIILSTHILSKFVRKVAVIGGGAAGFFSAIQCARQLQLNQIQYEVTILEASSTVLSKVKISGGGRCNVMHNPEKDNELIAKGYPRGNKELLSPFNSQFGPKDTYKWFLSEGIQLKTEADGRVFPVTDSSSTIIELMLKLANKFKINIIYNANVKSIDYDNSTDTDRFTIKYLKSNELSTNVITTRNTLYKDTSNDYVAPNNLIQIISDSIIVATGSSRLGYKIIEGLGHSISKPIPSLFSFKVKDNMVTELAGISSDKVEVKVVIPSNKDSNYDKIKSLLRPTILPTYTQQGPLLFTHQGMSGPAVLRLSSYGAKLLYELNYKFNISINYLPTLKNNEIFDLLWNEKTTHPNRFITKGFPSYLISNSNTLITKRLWIHILIKSGIVTSQSIDNIENDIIWEKIKKIDIEKICNTLINCRYEIYSRGEYKDEFVTCGGINLKEVNFDNLESKVIPGLYFAGEVLDIDGVTGGYNFQSAWTTGWIAGNNVANKLNSFRT